MRLMVMDAMTFGWGILKIALAVTAAWIAADLRTNKKKHSVFISAQAGIMAETGTCTQP